MPEAEAMAIQDKIGWEVLASEDAKEGAAPSPRSAPRPTTGARPR